MSRNTQRERVLAMLLGGEEISSLMAAYLPRPIMDLPKRVSELRRDGYDIKSRREMTQNGHRYLVYFMEV